MNRDVSGFEFGLDAIPGEKYILSFDAKSDIVVNIDNHMIARKEDAADTPYDYDSNVVEIENSQDWKRYSIQLEVPEWWSDAVGNLDYVNLRFIYLRISLPTGSTLSSDATVALRHLQLEKGTIETGWKERTQDIQEYVSSQIDVSISGISSTVTNLYTDMYGTDGDGNGVLDQVAEAKSAIETLDSNYGELDDSLNNPTTGLFTRVEQTESDLSWFAEKKGAIAWLNFSADDFLRIGTTDSKYNTQITNSEFNVRYNTDVLTSVNQNGLHTKYDVSVDGSVIVGTSINISPLVFVKNGSNGILIKSE